MNGSYPKKDLREATTVRPQHFGRAVHGKLRAPQSDAACDWTHFFRRHVVRQLQQFAIMLLNARRRGAWKGTTLE